MRFCHPVCPICLRMKSTELNAFLDTLPMAPGVYLMKGLNGRVVYVGKARNLRQRVRQYFAPSSADTRYFVRNLAARLSAIEVVITGTEKEALLLEYNLIRRHMPRYNIRLTDDKRFLHLRLQTDASWPRLELVRRPRKDKALYFGPYPSATGARDILRMANRFFLLRTCSDRAFRNRTRPCLQYQIHRCPGPCTLSVDREHYLEQVRDVRLFLEGRRDDLLRILRQRMETAAAALEYETAARLRDQIRSVEEALARQTVTDICGVDRDVIGMVRQGGTVAIVVMEILRGQMSGQQEFFFTGQEFPDAELLSSFVVQHYSRTVRYPEEVLLPVPISEISALQEFIAEQKGSSVRILSPARGPRMEQVKLAIQNAQQVLRQKAQQRETVALRLDGIQKRLHLPLLPQHMECVDIAHLSGTNVVGAISVMRQATLDKSGGRVYRVRSRIANDDYQSMREVLQRRFARAVSKQVGWDAPDLLVVDGGKGQLAIALSVLSELGLTEQTVVALAKARSENSEDACDRVFLPGRVNPIPLRENTDLRLLAELRDEAHRLANTYQERSRRRRTLDSALNAIPGVGPRLRLALLTRFGSVHRISKARPEELQEVAGVGPKLAQTILLSLKTEK